MTTMKRDAQIIDSHPALTGSVCDVCQDDASATLILTTSYGLRELDVCSAGTQGAAVIEFSVGPEGPQREPEVPVSAIADPWSDGTALARIRRD